ncbi:MAG: hypothetical protein AAFQ02_00540 [Bacteroidota bacterium]
MEDRMLYRTYDELFKAEVIKAKLNEAGVAAWVINKKDSAYNMPGFGHVELYIRSSDEAKVSNVLGTQD